MGYLVATWMGLWIYLSMQFLPIEVSAIIGVISGILFTGAFHEDGFADLCDGFGGGWQPEDILRIMKDSRLGTYGVTGLLGILLLKWQLLVGLLDTGAFSYFLIALVSAHSASRFFSIALMMVLPYVQADKDSKAKPIAQDWHGIDMTWAALFGLAPLLLLVYLGLAWYGLLLCLAIGLINFTWIQAWYRQRLNGYTGDALGASQQIQEISLLIVLLACFPH